MNKTKEKTFVGLTDDLLFKESFAHQDNRKILEYFLETILHYKRGFLHNKLDVTYESVLNKDKYKEKSMRGDIIIKFDKTIINLEAYSYFDYMALCKSTCYVMKIFSGLLEGDTYNNLEQVVQINLVDTIKTKIGKDIENNYYLTNEVHVEDSLLKDKFMIKYLRIDKAKNTFYNEDDARDRWLKFIGAKTEEEREMYAKGDKLLMEFHEWLNKYVLDEKTKKMFDEWNYQIAINQGLEQGMENIVKVMYEKGLNENQIQAFTDIPIETIKEIINEKL